MSKSIATFAYVVAAIGMSGCPTATSTSGGDDNPRPVLPTCTVEGEEARLPLAASRATGAPRLDCYAAAAQPAESTAVVVEGCIDIFGVGLEAVAGVEVVFFDRDASPLADTALARGPVVLASSSQNLACAGADADEPACRALGCESGGFYRAVGAVPTETPLIIRITSQDNPSVVRTFLYDVVLAAAAVVDVGGELRANYEATLIYSSTYTSIQSLGGRSIEGGNDTRDFVGRGVIAGEIHDCDDLAVEQAVVVDVGDDPQSRIVYFNGSTTSPGPEIRNTATSSDGRYANLNVTTAGEQHVIAAGIRTPGCDGDDCACVSLGTRSVQAFPDSVTIVTLRGPLP
jgi:hypothetical protein